MSDAQASSTRSAPAARAQGLVFVLLGITAFLTFISVAPASAMGALRSFEGQLTEANGSAFQRVNGLATDADGNIWVADDGGPFVNKFDSNGNFLAQSNGEGSFASIFGSIIQSLAYAKSSELIYVAQGAGNGTFYLWGLNLDTTDPGINFFAIGDYFGGFPAAVDNSGGPTDGTIFAAQAGVRRMDPLGNPASFSGSVPYISDNRLNGTPSHPFGGVEDIAVDADGNIYVADRSHGIDKFNSSGIFLRSYEVDAVPRAVAVDPTNQRVLVADELGTVYEFESGGDLVETFTGEGSGLPGGSDSLGPPMRMAIDQTGKLYISDTQKNVVNIFGPAPVLPKVTYGAPSYPTHTSATLRATVDPNSGGDVTSCHFEYGETTAYELGSVPCSPPNPPNYSIPTDVTTELSGLTTEKTYHYRLVIGNAVATRPSGDRTVVPPAVLGLSTKPVSAITTSSATLNAEFNGDGLETHYYFEYGPTSSYGLTSTPPPGTNAGSNSGTQSVSDGLGSLRTGTLYHYRVVASNSLGITKGVDETFTTHAPPLISGVSSSNLTASSAELHAKINPEGFSTHYYFEYGPTGSYGQSQPVPAADIGSGNTFESVSVALTDLAASTTYHFRLVATSEWGTSVSEDQTFGFYSEPCPNATVRQQASANYLPDCRSYELVSPEDAAGTVLFTTNVPNSGYATSPSRLAYTGFFGLIPGTGNVPGTVGESPGTAGDLYIATRTTDGWTSKYIGLPSTEGFMMAGPPSIIQSGGLNQPDKSQIMVPGNRTLSKVADWDEGDLFNQYDGLGSPQGDASHAPYIWDSGGNRLGRAPSMLTSVDGGEEAFICSYAPVLGQFAVCDEAIPTGSPELTNFAFTSEVDFTSDGFNDVPGEIYDNDMIANSTTVASKLPNGTRFAIPAELENRANPAALGYSTDGSHLLMRWNTREYPNKNEGLYMRVNNALTYSVSRGAGAVYAGMTADGGKVFFTTGSQLTPDDTDSSVDLYMWSETGDSITRISVGDTPGTGNNDSCSSGCSVLTIEFSMFIKNSHDSPVAAANGDIYFFSPELLDQVPNPDLAPHPDGQENVSNLYVYRNGSVRLVATLDGGGIERMQVTPDGRFAAFLTRSRITDYDNAGRLEMYRYAADTGELSCRSCRPNGELPEDDVRASQSGLFMTEDGRTFFSTVDALVSRDTNAAVDVYEYVDGRPQLITQGTGSADGAFPNPGFAENSPGLIGVSANGTDVYFATFDVLVPQDRNGNQLKVYDARTNGGFAFNPPPLPCVAADECHGEGSIAPAPWTAGTGAAVSGGNTTSKPTKRKHKRKQSRAKKAKAAKQRQKARRLEQKRGGGR